jgi:hypothetical protein
MIGNTINVYDKLFYCQKGIVMMNRAICNMRKIVTLLSLYKQTAILNPGNSRVHFHVGISVTLIKNEHKYVLLTLRYIN